MEEQLTSFISVLPCEGYPLYCSALIVGLISGSFLNVIYSRFVSNAASDVYVPLIITISTPASHCPGCRHPLSWWQNIPLLSWVILKGRCFYCRMKISSRYPLTEAGCAVLFLALSCLITSPASLILACLFSWQLILLSMIDFSTLLLPDCLTLPLLWLGLLVSVVGYGPPLTSAVLGAAFGYLSLWLLYWLVKMVVCKDGMGYGDFKMLGAIGAWLGYEALPLICAIAAITGVGYSFIRRYYTPGKALVPFGPALSLAGLVIYISQKSDAIWLMSLPGVSGY